MRQTKIGAKTVVENAGEQTVFETLGQRDGSEVNRVWSGLN